MADSLLNTIISILEAINSGKKIDVQKKRIKSWMKESNLDIDALGALAELVTNKKYYSHIKPSLTFDDYHQFMIGYYERCFRENPQSDWADSCYSAGSSFVNWFVYLWRDLEVPRKAISDLKKLLAKLYIQGDEDLRTCIITSTLEHLFEHPQIAKYFSDWRKRKILRGAFNEALKYSNQLRKGS